MLPPKSDLNGLEYRSASLEPRPIVRKFLLSGVKNREFQFANFFYLGFIEYSNK